MNFENMKHISLEGKKAVRLEAGGGLVWKGLPEGYTALEYIETDGTQYIDTGFVPNQDSRIVCEFMYFGGSGIFGARNTTTSRGFCFRVTSGKWQPQYNGTLKRTAVASESENWHVADFDRNLFYIDGRLGAEFEYGEFTAPHPIALGAIMANREGVKTPYYGTGRYRSCRIYDRGVLVRDLLPCTDSRGNAGMYDTVSAQFFPLTGEA